MGQSGMARNLAGLATQSDGGTAAVALPVYAVRPNGVEALLGRLPAAHAAVVRLNNFSGALGSIVLLPGAEATLAGAVLGLGDGPALHGFGAAATSLPADYAWWPQPGDYSADDAALGFLLGAYRFDRLKRQKQPLAKLAAGAASPRAVAVAEAMCLARDLINTPPNLLGPQELADAAAEVAARFTAKVTRIQGTALQKRFPAMAAVGAGSDRSPEAVLIEWQGSGARADAPLISLCGKGVCFDTGGYDLKPSAGMLRMKKDMGGAAIMLGLAQAVMALDLPVRLKLRLGCVENSISGRAMRPSDVLTTQAGLTVEVGNTDAEGRLVLCDLLAEASGESPDWLIDAATLTGAARVALGPDVPALFCTNDELSAMILTASETVCDPVWRLPLFAGYESWIDSPVADLNTVASKPMAGAIIAALFLKRFVAKNIAWAHLDVYAWNDSTRPGRPEGGEAQTLRALLAAIETKGAEARPT
ncbi:MAG TPA: leucyl aminopeptidase family protein [Acidocella sp.]|nr:leucyl aminopeptidase family protein [Acidocella sp.]